MIFGADKIPDIAKGMGKGMRSLKNATNDIKGEIKRSADNQGIDTDFTKDISKEINKAKKEDCSARPPSHRGNGQRTGWDLPKMVQRTFERPRIARSEHHCKWIGEVVYDNWHWGKKLL